MFVYIYDRSLPRISALNDIPRVFCFIVSLQFSSAVTPRVLINYAIRITKHPIERTAPFAIDDSVWSFGCCRHSESDHHSLTILSMGVSQQTVGPHLLSPHLKQSTQQSNGRHQRLSNGLYYTKCSHVIDKPIELLLFFRVARLYVADLLKCKQAS